MPPASRASTGSPRSRAPFPAARRSASTPWRRGAPAVTSGHEPLALDRCRRRGGRGRLAGPALPWRAGRGGPRGERDLLARLLRHDRAARRADGAREKTSAGKAVSVGFVVERDESGPYVLPKRFVGTWEDNGFEVDGSRPPLKLRLDTLPNPTRIFLPSARGSYSFERQAPGAR
jgi:hypothetical protein